MKFTTATHTFPLTCGVQCEITELTGEQQEILTIQDGRSHTDKLNAMILSILVRVGSLSGSDLNEEFIKNMLGADKKRILTEARQYSLGWQDSFVLPYEYTIDGEGGEETLTEEVEIPLPSKHFAFKYLQVDKEVPDEENEGQTKTIQVDASYTEYAEIDRKRRITLPRTGLLVEFTLLDGKGEQRGANTKKKARSSHTLIAMRNPVYFEDKVDGKSKIGVSLVERLSKLPIMDIEALRDAIKKYEGEVKTEITFEHPDADNKPASEKRVKMDVLNTIVFFFPSGAI